MLPGFRFLFLATVLSVSMLIFGFGAAALLRASHQEFATLPLQPTPEMTFARPSETAPTLALLRIDPPGAEHEPSATVSPPATAAASADTSVPVLPSTAGSEQVASLSTTTDDRPVTDAQRDSSVLAASDTAPAHAPLAPVSDVSPSSTTQSSASPAATESPVTFADATHAATADVPADNAVEAPARDSTPASSAETPVTSTSPTGQVQTEPDAASQKAADNGAAVPKSADPDTTAPTSAAREAAHPDAASDAKADSESAAASSTTEAKTDETRTAEPTPVGAKSGDTPNPDVKTADAKINETGPANPKAGDAYTVSAKVSTKFADAIPTITPDALAHPDAKPESDATNSTATGDHSGQPTPIAADAPVTIAALHVPVPLERPKSADKAHLAVRKPARGVVKRPFRRVRLTQPVQQQPANPFGASPFGD